MEYLARAGVGMVGVFGNRISKGGVSKALALLDMRVSCLEGLLGTAEQGGFLQG